MIGRLGRRRAQIRVGRGEASGGTWTRSVGRGPVLRGSRTMRLLLIIPSMSLMSLMSLMSSFACLRENPAYDGAVVATGSSDTGGSSGAFGSTGPAATTGAAGAETTSSSEPATTGDADTTSAVSQTSSGSTGTTGESSGEASMGTTADTDTGTTADTDTGTSTGDTSTGEMIELPPEATLCGESGPWVFGEPQLLGMPVNVAQGDLDMWLSYNGATLTWSSYRDGARDTYRATRAGFGAPFAGAYANNSDIGLSTPGEDGKLALSKLDTRGYLSTKLPGDANFRIHVGDRKGQYYGPLSPLPLDFPGHPEAFDPHISTDDLRLYYAPAGAGQQLVVATRPGPDQPFAAPSAAPFVNVDDPDRGEADPTLPAHELVLIYTRSGAIESGGSELWFAARATIDAPFGPPQPVPGVNSPAHEASAHLSRDGCELFFARSTMQDEGAWDIYRSEIQ